MSPQKRTANARRALRAALAVLVLMPALQSVTGAGADPADAPGPEPHGIDVAAEVHHVLAGHPWLGHTNDPDRVLDALAEHPTKTRAPETFRARLDYAQPDGVLRVVASLDGRGGAAEDFLATHAERLHMMGDGARAIAWLTPDQVADWLVSPHVLFVEPDFPLEYLGSESTVAANARSNLTDGGTSFGNGIWHYNDTDDSLASDMPALPEAVAGASSTIAIIDSGIDKTHPDFLEWDCDIAVAAVPTTLDGTAAGECDSRIVASVVASHLLSAGDDEICVVTVAPSTLCNETTDTDDTQAAVHPATHLAEGASPTTDTGLGHGTHVAGVAAGNAHASRNDPNPGDYGGDGRVFGVAPEARIVSVSMGSSDALWGNGKSNSRGNPDTTWFSLAVLGMQWVLDHVKQEDNDLGIQVVLGAWGCRDGQTKGEDQSAFQSTSCRMDPAVQGADPFSHLTKELYQRNIVVVMPVGDNGEHIRPGAGEIQTYQWARHVGFSDFARDPHVVGVASFDVEPWRRSETSSFGINNSASNILPEGVQWVPIDKSGEDVKRPDLSAPGGSIWAARNLAGSLQTRGEKEQSVGPVRPPATAEVFQQEPRTEDPYAEISGTSVAAAHVAGAAALLFDACKKASEPVTALKVMQALMVGAQERNRTMPLMDTEDDDDWTDPALEYNSDGGEAPPFRVGYGPLDVRASLEWLLDNHECLQDNQIPDVDAVDVRARFPGHAGDDAGVQVLAQATDPDPDGAITAWDVDWGDGQTDPYSGGESLTADHTYGTAGDYTIRINVTDNAGGIQHHRETVRVFPPTEPAEPVVIRSSEDRRVHTVTVAGQQETRQTITLEDLTIHVDPLTQGAGLVIEDVDADVVLRNVHVSATGPQAVPPATQAAIDSAIDHIVQAATLLLQEQDVDGAVGEAEAAAGDAETGAGTIQEQAGDLIDSLEDAKVTFDPDITTEEGAGAFTARVEAHVMNAANALVEAASDAPDDPALGGALDNLTAAQEDPAAGLDPLTNATNHLVSWADSIGAAVTPAVLDLLRHPYLNATLTAPDVAPSNAPEDGQSFGIRVAGVRSLTMENVTVCQRPDAGDDPAAAALNTGVRISGVHNVSASGLFVCGVGNGVVVQDSSNVTLRDCRVWENSGVGVEFDGSHNNTVTGCRIHDNEGTGLVVAGQDHLVYDNVLSGGVDASGSGHQWNVTPTPKFGPNIVGGPLVAGNFWADASVTDQTCDSGPECPQGPHRPDGIADDPRTNPPDQAPLAAWTRPVPLPDLSGVDQLDHQRLRVDPGDTITLTDRSVDPDGFLRAWRWEYGSDATGTSTHWVNDTDADFDAATSPHPGSWGPLAWGEYGLDLTVTGNDGVTRSRNWTVLADRAPTLWNDTFNTTLKTGSKVDVQADVTDPDVQQQLGNDALTFEWRCSDEWGVGDHLTDLASDGSSGTCRYPPGKEATYNITVTVTDALGLRASSTREVDVFGLTQPPDVDFTMEREDNLTHTQVNFTDATEDSDHLAWIWDFGDGTSVTICRDLADDWLDEMDERGIACDVDEQSTGDTNHTYTTPSLPGQPYLVNLTVVDVTYVTHDTGNPDAHRVWKTSNVTVDNRLPEAKFSHTVTNNVTMFTDASVDPDGGVVAWNWTFESTTLDTPYKAYRNATDGAEFLHNFTDLDTYDVTLNVTDAFGGSNETVVQVTINNRPPEANFTWTWPGGGEDDGMPTTQDVITFDGTHSRDEKDNLVKWSWTFGDDSPPVEGFNDKAEPVHRYADNGTYNVTLRVFDGEAWSETLQKEVTVDNVPPEVAFAAPPNPTRADPVVFEDVSEDPDGHIVNWTWYFGDGTTFTTEDPDQRSPAHHYTEVGDHRVVLNVTDDDGATSETVRQLFVRDAPPRDITVDWTPAAPTTLEPVQFVGGATDPDGDDADLAWHWRFEGRSGWTESTQQNPVHTYARSGDLVVSLTVFDGAGNARSVSHTLQVQNRDPAADFSATPAVPLAGQPVSFAGDATDPEGAGIRSWHWDFGDGASASTRDPVHTYVRKGTYNVSLAVVDMDGGRSSAWHTVEVPNRSPSARLEANATEVRTLDPIAFAANTTDPDGSVVTWRWDFGDGASASGPEAAHAYAAPGDYTIRLTVVDNDGAKNSTAFEVAVANRVPVVAMRIDPASPEAGRDVRLLGSASDDDGLVVSWHWDLGDGSTSTQRNPLHRYDAPGAYTVTLEVADDDGDVGTAIREIVVVSPPPPASFKHSGEGSTVRFEGGEGTEHAWDFGDGNASTEAEPNHTYARKGGYVVIHSVVDESGESSSATDVVVVGEKDDTDPDGPAGGDKGIPAAPAWTLIVLLALLLRRRRP